MELDIDVLIAGAGLAGLGFGVQLVRKYQHRNFEIVEKCDHIGGTWLANSYPGCGCDVFGPIFIDNPRSDYCRLRPIIIRIHLSQTRIGPRSILYSRKFSHISKESRPNTMLESTLDSALSSFRHTGRSLLPLGL